jgi:AcrR family transcriptional regulator
MEVKPDAERKPYHHGNLHAALLAAAETVLERDGLGGLTLRAAAREAGVSHAGPRRAVGDLPGLLADLAAAGFERLRAEMEAAAGAAPAEVRLEAIGRSYVAFARAHPSLFLLMFRHERLEAGRPALVAARRRLFDTLCGAAPGGPAGVEGRAALLAAWAQVHGLAMLLLDGQLPTELASEEVVGSVLGTPGVHD